MTENIINDEKEFGSIKISNDVIATIAGIAATEVKGVSGKSMGFTGGITEMLGMRNLTKGVKVEITNRVAKIDISIIVEYGVDIAETAKKVQENIKKSVETMTDLLVPEVNVNIQGVNMETEKEEALED
nr:Asp23/Gls24 family envelope stress response protein [Tissierella sp.]